MERALKDLSRLSLHQLLGRLLFLNNSLALGCPTFGALLRPKIEPLETERSTRVTTEASLAQVLSSLLRSHNPAKQLQLV